MLQKILLLTVITAVYCQYPQQRAPPMRHRPPPEEYEEEYAPAPRRAPPPQPAFQPPRPNVVHNPASVHYVNIGLELAGDYKFGYDTGRGNDGQSFREETRLPDGTVQGAYGYVDETGRQRIVKYTAGKDGFKAEGDVGPEGAPRNAPRQAPAPAPAQQAPPPQQAYRPPPQQAYAPQPAPRPAPQPAPRPQPQPAYRPPPPPPTRPAYRAPQPAYAPEPQYNPRPRPQARPRPAPRPVESYDETPDYDYPTNDIGERRLVPVDTTLFNYNIGTSQDRKN